ncbi:hypothetical protein AX16_008382 [Volvariella volvacea WC 439]|nr:hypothetical protein AX16_008382 [Volvariella volvacea WC 439]
MHNLDYSSNAYLVVTLSSTSPFFSAPSTLASLHPSLSFVGQVGQLSDVQIVSVPQAHWEQDGNAIVASLRSGEGVVSVNLQQPKHRIRRRGDEL